eukprot:gene9987-18910_t
MDTTSCILYTIAVLIVTAWLLGRRQKNSAKSLTNQPSDKIPKKDQNEDTAIIDACQYGHCNVVSKLLQAGADID